MEHGHVRLRDGQDLEIPLYPGWREDAKKAPFNGNEFLYLLHLTRIWFEEDFDQDDVVSTDVAY